MSELWLDSVAWMALAAVSALVSIRLAVSVALVEVVLGAAAGNLVGLEPTAWVSSLAALGAIVLAFLAGAELDRAALRRTLGASVVIGLSSFAIPCAGVLAVARWGFGWSWGAAEIAGLALSETSVAVLFLILIELKLLQARIGQILLAASFVTNLCLVVALGVLYVPAERATALALGAAVAILAGAGPLARWAFPRLGPQPSEPQLRLIFVALFGLAALVTTVGSEAVLPAYILGAALAPALASDRDMVLRLRGVAFAVLTPFFFMKTGALVDAGAMLAGLGLMAVLLLSKLAFKFVAVHPLSAAAGEGPRARRFLILMMSTGLTFGNIVALYGFRAGAVDRAQYSVILGAVILSGIIPGVAALRWARPESDAPRTDGVGVP